jgi:single-stranded DNA-binding protein
MFVNVVAFSDSAKAALLALDDGDSLSLAGTLKIATYETRDGSVKPKVSTVAHSVLTAYQVTRKRKAVAETSASAKENGAARASAIADDDLTF